MLTQQDKKPLLIGQVTALSGVSIRTIRYYESLGLLNSSGRTEGGFGKFSSDVLTRLAFIKRAQSLGLNLEEIRNLLNIHDEGNLPCGEVKQKLEDKVNEIDHQIEELLTLRDELTGLLSGCDNFTGKRKDTICPIIQ